MTRRFANTIFAISILCGVVIALTNGYGQDPGARSSDHGSKLADEAGPGGLPENTSDGVLKSPTEYAKLIESELGVPPAVDLGACVEIPILVDGKKFTGDPGIHCCDNPSLQMGDWARQQAPQIPRPEHIPLTMTHTTHDIAICTVHLHDEQT